MIKISKKGFILLISVFLHLACGEDDKDTKDTTTPTTNLTYANVSSFITTSCAGAGCHASANSSNKNVDLSSHAGVKASAAKSVTAIEAGTMPQTGKAEFDADTTAKANLLEYLKAGAP